MNYCLISQEEDILIFCLETSACDELRTILSAKTIQNVPLLILANKCDLPNVLTEDEFRMRLIGVSTQKYSEIFEKIPILKDYPRHVSVLIAEFASTVGLTTEDFGTRQVSLNEIKCKIVFLFVSVGNTTLFSFRSGYNGQSS